MQWNLLLQNDCERLCRDEETCSKLMSMDYFKGDKNNDTTR